MTEFLKRTATKAKDFLFNIVNKEFLVFLFFLILSGAFWLSMTLEETYEKEYRIPIQLTGVPRKTIITTEMADSINVTLRDKGFAFIGYLTGNALRPIYVSFSSYAKDNGRGAVPLTDIQKILQKRFYKSTKITSLKPDKLEFYYSNGQAKTVPVRFAGKVQPAKNYYLTQMRITPEKVTVYASKNLLDSISQVLTKAVSFANINDTLVKEVELQKITGAKCVPSTVKVSLYPDILTEESIEVPITPVNVPEGKALRTFPSRIRISFVTGSKTYRTIKPEQFLVVADYADLDSVRSEKCTIHLRTAPQGVRNAKLETNQVDYLLEQ